MNSDLRSIAHRLNGEVSSGQVLFPAPGHSLRDRSACLRFDRQAPNGFVVHSFAGDDPLPIRDFIRERLSLPADSRGNTRKQPPFEFGEAPENPTRTAQALAIWSEGLEPGGTCVEVYLRHRGLELPEASAGEVIRYHPSCPFAGSQTPAMICLVRDLLTNEPRAIHRTALSPEGHKVKVGGHDRLSLGTIGGGAIKLTPDEDVTSCLGIGEGLESTLSLQLAPEFGPSPVWCLVSAGGVATLPILSGIDCLWISVDHDPAGIKAAKTCADTWRRAGREVFLITPNAAGADLNDIVQKGQHNARP